MILFNKPGPKNTETLLNIVKEKGEQSGIKNCVLASTRGTTALKAVEILKGFNIIVFTHYTGLRKPNHQEMPVEVRQSLESSGCKVFTNTHAFSGVCRSVQKKFGAIQTDQIIAATLKLFGQGVKVAIEVSMMAADTGSVDTTKKIISVGGTGVGADAALILTPANTINFFEIMLESTKLEKI